MESIKRGEGPEKNTDRGGTGRRVEYGIKGGGGTKDTDDVGRDNQGGGEAREGGG